MTHPNLPQTPPSPVIPAAEPPAHTIDRTTSPSYSPRQRALLAFSIVLLLLTIALISYRISASSPSPSAAADSQGSASPSSSPSLAVVVDPPSPDKKTPTGAPPFDIANAEVTLPPTCSNFVMSTSAPVQFVNGEAPSDHDQYATVTVEESTGAIFDGEDVVVANFLCFGGGNHAYSSIAVYDADRQLIGTYEAWGSPERHLLSSLVRDFNIRNLSAHPDGISFTVPALRFLNAADPTQTESSAHISLEWQDRSFVDSDVLLLLPTGELRPPSPQQIETVYSAIAEQRDREASRYLSSEVENRLNQTFGPIAGEGPTERELQFPPGANLSQCLPIADFKQTTLSFPDDKKITSLWAPEQAQPGDFVCGVDLASAPTSRVQINDGTYYAWFFVRPTADPEVFTIYATGRAFA